MNENFCEICKEVFSGNTSTIELSDDKQKIHISGHDKCAEELLTKIRNVKDLKKKSPKQILKEIKFNVQS